ncbi:hypothetical protein DOK78_001928 [Enterococcus sp. DIV2402]|uniref:Uncharacterized protein n=1 Tax=Candidatus Enterococcus lowellii TaxID=2230877 RepID=A0ABZ2SNQ9_9ENTE|nr:hypothetical protein [Enterococcus sp. DIV2402]MBO0463940.1 hypothetical protein [Enterococcus sp. DIV2402]
MKIVYPPLVEQSVTYHATQHISKADMYRSMVEKGIITENGLPTEYALENGWIKDFYEKENLSFDEFLAIYPIFEEYDQELFKLVDGFWEIPITLKEELLQALASENVNYDEKIQIEEYLADR